MRKSLPLFLLLSFLVLASGVSQGRTQTTTTLTVSENTLTTPNVVILNANVSPTVAGLVVFKDGYAVLGTVVLSNGNASYKTIGLGGGSHTLSATFLGTTSASPSSSNPYSLMLQPVPTSIALSSTGAPANPGDPAQFTATVSSSGGGLLNGFVDLFDNGLGVASAPLAAPVNTFAGKQTIPSSSVGASPLILAMADVNGDGIPDLLTSSSTDDQVAVFLGNGDGTFRLASTNITKINNPRGIAIGDFNADGYPDFAVVSDGNSKMEIWLGNGDGTFNWSSQVILDPVSGPWDIDAADINNDGILDLVIADSATNTVSVWLGNGDGTFTTKKDTQLVTGLGPKFLTVADFNGDGKPDVAVADYNNNYISVLLGNGDGTFQSPQTILQASSNPETIVSADMDGDGDQDLIVTNYGSNTVSVFLNDGHANFTLKGNYPAGLNPYGLAAADIDGDGKPDVVLTNRNASHAAGQDTVGVLLGNGDGSLNAMNTFATGQGPVGVVAGDFDGGGRLDLAVLNLDDGTVSTYLSSTSSQAELQAMLVPGLNTLSASYEGGLEFDNSSSSSLTETVVRNSSSISLSAPGTLKYGDPITLTATVTGVSGVTPTGTVTFYYGGSQVGSPMALDSNGTASRTLSTLPVGSYSNYTATYSGDRSYTSSTSSVVSFTIAQAPVTVTGITENSKQYDGTTGGVIFGLSGAVLNGISSADAANVSLNASAATGSYDSPGVGTVPVTASGFSLSGNAAGNYTLTQPAGLSGTITPAPLTIGVLPVSKMYGSANPAFTPTFSGFVNNETAAVLSGSLSFTTTAAASSPVGSYAITPGGVSSTNYMIAFTSNSLTITPAQLMVTATNQSRNYGAANPPLTYSISGYGNGDSSAVVSGAASCSTTATASSVAGTYPITCTQGTLAAANYAFSFVGGTLTIAGVDLLEQNVSYAGTPAAGGNLQVTETALNQGTASSASSITYFYVSTTPTGRNTYVGSRSVPSLAANAASGPVTTTLPLPVGLSGNYYLVACANGNGAIADINAGNNCSASSAMNIAGPDLVESIAGPSSAVAGQWIQVTTTTTNQGAGSAASSLTFVYLGTSPTSRSNYLGTVAIATLAGNSSSGPVSSRVMLPPGINGSYYLVACANANGAVPEANSSNNCASSAAMSVAGPDLVNTVSGPSSAAAGGMIAVSLTTANQGLGASPNSLTMLYLSPTPTGRNTYLGSASIAALAANASTGPATIHLTLPLGIYGTYYLVACTNADGSVGESNTSNDCSASAAMTVAGADLVASVTGPSTAVAGGAIQVTATTANQGAGAAGSSLTYLYLGTSSTSRSTYLGTVSVANLSGNSSSGPIARTLTLPTGISGSYYIVACANANGAVNETNYSNDCGATAPISVTAH